MRRLALAPVNRTAADLANMAISTDRLDLIGDLVIEAIFGFVVAVVILLVGAIRCTGGLFTLLVPDDDEDEETEEEQLNRFISISSPPIFRS